jgi:ABC-type spermidine/putrescine transport system, permease component I
MSTSTSDQAALGTADHASARARFSVRHIPLILLAPSIVLLFVFLVLPLAIIVLTSLQPNVLLTFDAPGIGNYGYMLSKSYYLAVIVRTVRIAFVTTLIGLPISFLAAILIYRLDERFRNIALMGLTFPVLTGPLAIVLGYMALLTDGGPLFGPMIELGLIPPLKLLGTETAVIISLIQFVLPFAVLTLYTAVSRIPQQLYEAVTSLGGARMSCFLHVTLPLSLPGLLSASIICFSLAASSYVSPYYLGGAAQQTLTTLISQFILATYNSQLAAAAAVLLLVVMLVTIVAITAFFRKFIR